MIRSGSTVRRLTFATLAAVALGLAVAACQPAHAQAAATPPATTFQITYAVNIYGVTAGEASYAVTFANGRYEARSSQRATGLARTAVGKRQDYTSSAKGAYSASAITPDQYQHQGGRRNRLVQVDYSATDVVTTATPALGSMGNPPATTAQKLGSTDTLSSFVSMMVSPGAKDPCTRTIKVFDGRKRFDLVFKADGTQRMRLKDWKGTATRCKATYTPVAGYTDPPEKFEPMTFIFGRLDNGLWAPLRIEWPTEDSGPAILEARSLKSSGPKLF